jgi:hypothetical protein
MLPLSFRFRDCGVLALEARNDQNVRIEVRDCRNASSQLCACGIRCLRCAFFHSWREAGFLRRRLLAQASHLSPQA